MARSDAQAGIQQLMHAEQDAQAIVTAARQEKIALLKRAKEESDKEVAAYRAQREAAFQENSNKNAGSKDEYANKLSQEADVQISQVHSTVAGKSEDVIKMLLDSVTDVFTEVIATTSGDKVLA